MIRTINIILGICSLFVLIGVYGLKYAVEVTAGDKVELERTIERQEGELSLLKAEWSLLNQPGHIEPIIRRHSEVLNLLPVSTQQFGDIASLPMRPAKPDTQAMDDLFQSLAAGVDPIDQILSELQ
jgi:hypothetical protein